MAIRKAPVLNKKPSVRYHHGALRPALIKAAWEAVSRDGVEALSLRSLADALGVSHAAPAHHFANREALLDALQAEAFRRFTAVLEEGASTGALEGMGLAYVRFAHEQPNAFALVFDAQLCPPCAPNADSAPLIAANEALLRDCVAALQQADDVPDVYGDALGAALWGTVHGLAQLVMAGHLPMDAVEPALRALLGLRAPRHG